MMLAISYLGEIIAILICLFWLHGKRIRISIPVISLTAVYLIFFATMLIYRLDHIWSVLIYPIIYFFCIWEFKDKFKPAIGYCIFMLLIVGMFQILVATILELLSFNIDRSELYSLLINLFAFIMIYVMYKFVHIHHILANMHIDSFFMKSLLSVIIGGGMVYFIIMKINPTISGTEYFAYYILTIIIIFLVGTWEKYRIKANEKELELRTSELYADAYQTLIDTIRARQHEYDNHIHTIINQRYICNTYEDLVEAQKEYIDSINAENKHVKLLRSGNKTFIAFLYGKILSLEEKGIESEYKIEIDQLEAEMPVYKMIEIVNNLLVNAQEAIELSSQTEKKIKFVAYETKEVIDFEVWNCGEPINSDNISKCFKKGVTSKGKNRGLGLYNVKQICDRYHADIAFENRMLENKNWITFIIKIPKSG